MFLRVRTEDGDVKEKKTYTHTWCAQINRWCREIIYRRCKIYYKNDRLRGGFVNFCTRRVYIYIIYAESNYVTKQSFARKLASSRFGLIFYEKFEKINT